MASGAKKKELQEEIDTYISVNPDNIFGIRETLKGLYMGNMTVKIIKGDIIIDDRNSFKLTDGLRNLIFYRGHNSDSYTANDFSTYGKILKLTGAMHNNNDPSNPHFKWRKIDSSIQEKAKIIKEDIWDPYTQEKYYKKKPHKN